MRAIFEESLHLYSTNRVYRRAHLVYLLALAGLVVALWPNASYIEFFKLSSYPALFEVVGIGTLLLAAGGSMYVGKNSLGRDAFVTNTDWVEKTTLPIMSITGGRILIGILHTTFLAGVAFPLLVVAAGPSGVPIIAVLQTLLVVSVTSLASRFGGMFVDACLERRPILSVPATWLILGVIFVISIEVLPDMNPIVALTSVSAEIDLSFASFRMALEPLYLRSVVLLGILATVFAVATFVALSARRRRYRKSRLQEVR
jgi:hypothetical protein